MIEQLSDAAVPGGERGPSPFIVKQNLVTQACSTGALTSARR
jgi:hypothetical protein